MNQTNELIDFVKAMAEPDRLRIIGVVAARPATAGQIAGEVKLSIRDAVDHLEHLERVGVIRKTGGLYAMETKRMESMARRQFAGERESYVPANDLDAKTRKVLATYLNPDGSIQQIPPQATKLRIILDYLLDAFLPAVNYTEKEVNAILGGFHADTAGLRRDLIDAGLLERASNGSRYWRPI